MSMDKLNFYDEDMDRVLNIVSEEDELIFQIKFGRIGDERFSLDRSQAHLLMLYLQEHLK